MDLVKVGPRECEKRSWSQIVATVIFAVSGHVPAPDEMRRLRGAFFAIAANLARDASDVVRSAAQSESLAFAVMPYVFCGFEFNDRRRSCDGRNSTAAASSLLRELLTNAEPHVTTALCAHRESKLIDRGALVSEIDAVAVTRMANLVSGIVANLRPGAICEWTVYQPAGTPEGVMSLFPNVVLRHVGRGEMAALLAHLNRHLTDLANLLRGLEGVRPIRCSAVPTDGIAQAASAASRALRNGERISLEAEEGLNEKINQIATEDACPDLRRMMPGYEDAKRIEPELVEVNMQKAEGKARQAVADAVDSFMKSDNLADKASHETLFYYELGRQTRLRRGVFFGFERDHDSFQVKSINLGFDGRTDVSRMTSGGPALFARRSRPESDQGNLGSLSFRQFWRPSDVNFPDGADGELA